MSPELTPPFKSSIAQDRNVHTFISDNGRYVYVSWIVVNSFHARKNFRRQLKKLMELFSAFPHESGIVMQRGIELGILVSSCLLAHSLFILNEHDRSTTSHFYMDVFFEAMLLLRVVFAIPRPYIWLSTWRKFIQARTQPTPQLVGEALTDIYTKQNALEKFLLYFYYGWLLFLSLVTLLTPYRTEFGRSVWNHLLLNYACIVLHRMTCIGMFYYLVNSDIPRGIHPSVIEKESRVVIYADASHSLSEPECSICFAEYEKGDEIRILKCKHEYHKSCVDQWLMRHRNRCPKCLTVVGSSSVASWRID